MIGYLSTNFSRLKYFEICNKLKDKEFPILTDESNMPLLDKNNEPKRDTTDREIIEYNNKIGLLRIIELIKLMGNGLDLPDDNDECVEIVKNISDELFNIIKKAISDCIEFKFIKLPEQQNRMIRSLLSASKFEKSISDRENKKYEQELDRLIKELQILRNRYQQTEDEEEKKIIEKKIKELEDKLDELQRSSGKIKDNYGFEHGVKMWGLMAQMKAKYFLSDEIFLKLLNNKLSEEEKLMVDILYSSYTLDNQHEASIHAELKRERDKTKNTK